MDINGDGHKDLIFGEGNKSNINYYSRNEDGTLHAEGNLFTLSYEVSKEASPVFSDMDNDGDLDLILGSSATWKGGARMFYYENRGSQENYSFEEGKVLLSGEIAHGAKVTVADLNRDGIKDILFAVGFPAELKVLKNIGTKETPLFSDQPIALTMKDDSEITANTYPISANTTLKPTFRVSICDWNEDGIPDLLCGRSVPVVLLGPASQTSVYDNIQKRHTYKSKALLDNDLGVLNLYLPADFQNVQQLRLFNIKGQLLWQKSGSNLGLYNTLRVGSIGHSIYFLEIYCDKQREVIVVEGLH